ncbi:MAG: MBL fold metallo-hydrolase [Pararhodobacter sp.]|nr:MBL fold metallo-hydrolase [Pararhodobacter sp.]
MLEEGLRLVLAPNPSPMTERGTNSYLLGEGALTVIDPGPDDSRHVAALLAAPARGERIIRILVSHAHVDHSPAARILARETGAPVLAYGDALAGRSARMQRLAGDEIGGGEGVDTGFRPDEALPDGGEVDIGGLALRALHTPGHFGNHLSFLWGQALFSGDTVMGWAPSLVSPPDGDLTDFMASLDRLEELGPTRLYSGHGAPVDDGPARIRALRAHRLAREAAIRAALDQGARDAGEIVQRVYTDVAPALIGGALRNVLAHLIDLEARELAEFEGPPGLRTRVHPRAG